MFNMIEFLECKRDGGRHTREDLQSFISGVMDSSVPNYQLSAWLMAAYLKGLDDDETMYLTEALARSGSMLSYPAEQRIIDKHSTGGVGDKTTLVLVPLVASCGAVISKLSGPGLGITGGTVDKLESIPGMNLHLSAVDFKRQVEKIGCAISGHSVKLAPAEGKFYKMRDVTATVPSIQLITSSIISKKLAGGASGYIFDVKCGSGAFMKDLCSARALAENLVKISKKLGKACISIITDMEQPLGEWVGNAAEVCEAIEVLGGKGPVDTRELCVEFGGNMLLMSGAAETVERGREMCRNALDDGAALKKFAELVEAEGGDVRVTESPKDILPKAALQFDVTAKRSGYVSELKALMIGEGLRLLGGGRMKEDDTIDHAAAIHLNAKIGDKVEYGDAVISVYCNTQDQLDNALPYILKSLTISDSAEKRKLILEHIC